MGRRRGGEEWREGRREKGGGCGGNRKERRAEVIRALTLRRIGLYALSTRVHLSRRGKKCSAAVCWRLRGLLACRNQSAYFAGASSVMQRGLPVGDKMGRGVSAGRQGLMRCSWRCDGACVYLSGCTTPRSEGACVYVQVVMRARAMAGQLEVPVPSTPRVFWFLAAMS